MAQPSYKRVPTSLDPVIARDLNKHAYENDVSKSSIVETALREFFAHPNKIAAALRRHGASKKRRSD